jgi:FAD/FMN-containing dehydrogenase
VEAVIGTGLLVAALEYLDAGALAAAPPTFLAKTPAQFGFAVLCQVDGSAEEVAAEAETVAEVLGEGALAVQLPRTVEEVGAVWRWREGMSVAVTAQRGGKVSEDIVVPLDRLGEAIIRTCEIGQSVSLPACSWGHAGDGNLHSTFLIDRMKPSELRAAERAAEQLFALAVELGGSISGEHGLGLVKSGHLRELLGSRGLELHRGVKQLFDPKNLLNPGKKC